MAPARTPGYYRVPYTSTTSNGVTGNTLMGAPVWSVGITTSKWTLACWDTWAEVLAELTGLGIPTAHLKDPKDPIV